MMAGTAGVKDTLMSDDLKISGSTIDLVRFFGPDRQGARYLCHRDQMMAMDQTVNTLATNRERCF